MTVTLDGHGADELLSGYQQGIMESLWDTGLNPAKIMEIMKTYQGTKTRIQLNIQVKIALGFISDYMIKKTGRKLLRRDFKSIKIADHPNYGKLDNMTQYLYMMFHETDSPLLYCETTTDTQ